MADSADFEGAARVIERTSSLSELQSRGLVRRLLKDAGLSAHDVSGTQLAVVGRTLLAEALQKHGIENSSAILTQWQEFCARQTAQASGERTRLSNTVEEVFARMGLKR